MRTKTNYGDWLSIDFGNGFGRLKSSEQMGLDWWTDVLPVLSLERGGGTVWVDSLNMMLESPVFCKICRQYSGQ